MPAPMTAPTPSAVNWTGPSVRFRLCSPASFASASNMLIGFLANKGLPMQLLLLLGISPTSAFVRYVQFGLKPLSIVGAQHAAPLLENSVIAWSQLYRPAATTTTRAGRPGPQSKRSRVPFRTFASGQA